MTHTVAHSTFYRRADYGPNPHEGANRNNAQSRGWGPGWPDCQRDRLVKVSRAGVSVVVRREIAELVAVLFELSETLGYDICHLGSSPPADSCCGTWGFSCRPIRGTRVPSNHSWGLAVDVNAPCNPMSSTFRSNLPPAVVAEWEKAGFYWGGRYANRPDAMHFEYIGGPADVAEDLARARAALAVARRAEPPASRTEPRPAPARWEPYRRVAPATRRVSRWAAGDDVKALQRVLSAWYPRLPRLAVDGYFGPSTEDRVRFMQRRARLTQDGVVGPVTWRKLGYRWRG